MTPLAVAACSSEPLNSPPDNMGPADSGFINVQDAGFADAGTPMGGCEANYPAHASVMTLGEAVEPWSWTRAIDGLNNETDLDLTQAFCDTDPDIDWSPFDYLLFVSIPGW